MEMMVRNEDTTFVDFFPVFGWTFGLCIVWFCVDTYWVPRVHASFGMWAPLAYHSLIWELEAPAVWSRPMALILDVCFSVCQFYCPCQKLSEYIFLLTILKMCCKNVLWYYGHMVFDRRCMIGLYQKCKTDTIWKMCWENTMVLWLHCFNQPLFFCVCGWITGRAKILSLSLGRVRKIHNLNSPTCSQNIIYLCVKTQCPRE